MKRKRKNPDKWNHEERNEVGSLYKSQTSNCYYTVGAHTKGVQRCKRDSELMSDRLLLILLKNRLIQKTLNYNCDNAVNAYLWRSTVMYPQCHANGPNSLYMKPASEKAATKQSYASAQNVSNSPND